MQSKSATGPLKTRAIFASLAIATVLSHSGSARQPAKNAARHERLPVGNSSIYVREIGQGQTAIVLHGGPDFDHSYLLPELDRLSDAYRLIYYDQRGRGRSAAGVRAEDVTLESDLADLDRLRQHLRLESVALIGHSWGTVLALEYALRYPGRVSHLILMNPAPASAADVAILRKVYLQTLGADMDRQREILASPAYKEGNPEAVAARYRIHFKHAFKRSDDYEKLMTRMKAEFIREGKDGIVKARAVEDRLMLDTWQAEGYDLMPKLRTLRVPTLIISGDSDFIPGDIAAHIAQAMPSVRHITIRDCGHFSYMECPAGVRTAIDDFFRGAR